MLCSMLLTKRDAGSNTCTKMPSIPFFPIFFPHLPFWPLFTVLNSKDSPLRIFNAYRPHPYLCPTTAP